MDSLELLIDLHRNNPRQGPGGDAQTELALRLTGLDPATPLTVADIGCGTGAATLALAWLLPRARITAVDFLAPFLGTLQQRCEAAGVTGRVMPLGATMSELPFADFLSRHDLSEAAMAVVAEHEQEIALYEANSMYFSYGLCVARRVTFPPTSHPSP